MSEQDPLQPPSGGNPPNPGANPPPYGANQPPPYGASPPPYGASQPPYSASPPPYGANPPPYTGGAPTYGAPVPLDDAQTRQWAGLAHLGGILFFLPSLIIWLVYRERSAFVAQEAKKALNFQITVAIGYAAVFVLALLSVPFTGLMRLAIWIVAVIFCIQGYQAVQRGQAYRYPVTLELIT